MSEPRRILLINYEYPPLGGGGGNATLHIGHELAAMGEQVHVLTAAWGGSPPEETVKGVRLHRIAALRRRADRCSVAEMAAFMIAATLQARGLARLHRIDVALAFFTLPCGPVAWWLKRSANVPYAISLQGGDVPGFDPETLKSWHHLTGGWITALWRAAGAVVANSDGLAELARAHAPDVAIEVIPAGVAVDNDTAKIDYDHDGTLNLLFAGRLVPQKGLDVLLEALARLPEDAPPWRLTLAGDGPAWTALAARALKLGLTDHLKFLGWCRKEELPAIYRAADVFVLPSRDEGMSNALLEAMAAGVPALCTDVAGMRDVITPGETGLIVPPEDPDALSKALLTLLTDTDLRARLGRAGRGHVVRRFSWTRAARSWRAILHRIAAPAGATAP